jgi:hypothetical protein
MAQAVHRAAPPALKEPAGQGLQAPVAEAPSSSW